MKVGIPREVKNHEYRVAITPAGVHELVKHGHEVFVETDAGVGSSITNEEFEVAGAKILSSADDVWGTAELILAKQRNGPTGVVKLAFLREQTRFANLAPGGGG